MAAALGAADIEEAGRAAAGDAAALLALIRRTPESVASEVPPLLTAPRIPGNAQTLCELRRELYFQYGNNHTTNNQKYYK